MNANIKWLVGILLLPTLYGGWQAAIWAMDTHIQQQITPQIKQLRIDVRNDAIQDRISYLEMRLAAGIITSDEEVELNYLLKRSK